MRTSVESAHTSILLRQVSTRLCKLSPLSQVAGSRPRACCDPCLLGISCVPGQAGWGQARCIGGLINEIDPPSGYLHPFLNPDPDLSASSAELDAEHSQKVLEMEQTQQLKLKERQKFFEEAFQQDMEQYLSTGYLQVAERRGKSGSP